jgi:hypothetical protein
MTVSGRMKRPGYSIKAFEYMAGKCEPYRRMLGRDTSMRWFVTTVVGRSGLHDSYGVAHHLTIFHSEQLRKQRAADSSAMRNTGNKQSAPRKGPTVANDLSDIDDSESTIDLSTIPAAALPRLGCGSCRTKDSQYWWKAPKGFDLSSTMLCDSCGMLWRKYADLKGGRGDDPSKPPKILEKREGTSITGPVTKRIKVCISILPLTLRWGDQLTIALKIDPFEDHAPLRPQRTCLCCKKSSPHHLVLACQRCGVTIHPGMPSLTFVALLSSSHLGCAGAKLSGSIDTWQCELCDNERTTESSLVRQRL